PLRRVVAPSVYARRPVREGQDSGGRHARRSAEDALRAEGRRTASSRDLEAAGAVLGDGVRLGHAPAAAECGVAQARGALDVGVAVPDVALRHLARDVVLAGGLPEPQPVAERPLLPGRLARD